MKATLKQYTGKETESTYTADLKKQAAELITRPQKTDNKGPSQRSFTSANFTTPSGKVSVRCAYPYHRKYHRNICDVNTVT